MQEIERDDFQVEIQDLIEELKEREMLSDEVREEVNSLLDEGRYQKAGRVAVDFRSERLTFVN